ncbi:asparagine synthase-related protein [Alphaproteobacteria bacterium]|nr:asparagine synthase-related protein [Alphaproteobacteria bacterium]
MEFNIPHINLSWSKKSFLDLEINNSTKNNNTAFKPKELELQINQNCFDYYKTSNQKKIVVLIGSPIVNEMVDFEATGKFILNNNTTKDNIAKINGQFLVFTYEFESNSLTIINDRFNSIHFYWANIDDKFYGSFLYFDLFKKIKNLDNFKINQSSVLQFLWMSRVMGDQTHDNFSKYLLPASILQINSKEVTIENYWRPNFKKIKRSKKEAGKKYIDLLVNSLKKLTTEKKKNRYGYFFSSGLDSRTVSTAVSLVNKKLKSFTVAFSENLEVKYARQAANLAGSEHKFIKLDKNHFEKNLDANVMICGSMYSVHDALFTGLKKTIEKDADIVFHGHALDFWHYGNYLPSYFIKIFGSQTFIRRLMKLDNMVDLYYKYNPLRLTWTNKTLDLKNILKHDKINIGINYIKSAIKKDLDEGSDCCKTKVDQWEYLMLHSFGRHFTNINITSKLTTAKVRTPAFDNEILDFYLSIPSKQRLTDEIRIYALNNIGPKIGNIPTANHGFPAGDSALTKTIKLVLRKLKRIITRNFIYSSPTLQDRTWPNLNNYLKNSDLLLNEINKALHNEYLIKNLDILDWKKLRIIFEEWKKGEEFDPIFWFCLISLNRFIELSEE